jgi:hypothetical protein
MDISGRGYRINGKQHMLLYNHDEIIKVEDKDYFNKNTQYINIIKGVECDNRLNPINDKEIKMIEVVYIIANYFGDRLGHHWRTKQYMLVDDILYNNDGEQVKRIPKEINLSLEECNVKM